MGIERMAEGDRKALQNLLVSFSNLMACRNEPLPYPNLDENELSPKMLEMVGRAVFGLIDERDRRGFKGKVSDEECWLIARSWFGLKCSHPVTVPYCKGAVQCKFCKAIIVRCK